MFYSENVLARKGPLANIWLAAHWDRKLTKAQIVQTNIQSSVDEIIKGGLPPMALRLSGQLLLGASRIYWRKARYLLEDCGETLDRLKLNFKVDGQVDMPQDQARAPLANITLATNYTMAATNLLLPEPELDLDEILNMVATQPGAMGKENDTLNLKEKFNVNKPFNFERSDAHNDSLLQAFPMPGDFEIETGRRLTDLSGMNMSRDTNPFISHSLAENSAFALEDPSGIEVGRKDLSVASAFSPMRLSTPGSIGRFSDAGAGDARDDPALGAAIDFDMNDGITWEREGQYDASDAPGAAVHSPLGAAPFNTPPRPTAAKSRKRKVVLDEVTELSSSVIQRQVKDTSDILLRGSKRAMVDEAAAAMAVDETRRLSLTAMSAPGEFAALLARPAIDSDFVMDAFGDLFKDNPLVSVPKTSARALAPVDQPGPSAQLADDVISDNFGLPDMNDDYHDMNPEAPMAEDSVHAPFEMSHAVSADGSDMIGFADRKDTTHVDVIAALTEAAVDTLSFQSVIAGKSRSAAAKTFFSILALSSKGLVRAEQPRPFGQIALRLVDGAGRASD